MKIDLIEYYFSTNFHDFHCSRQIFPIFKKKRQYRKMNLRKYLLKRFSYQKPPLMFIRCWSEQTFYSKLCTFIQKTKFENTYVSIVVKSLQSLRPIYKIYTFFNNVIVTYFPKIYKPLRN